MGLSEDEVAALYRRHADVVFRRCIHMLGNRAEAMDAVQEIFTNVLTHRLAFRGDSDPTTWVYRITTNHVLNRLRSRRPQSDVDSLPLTLHPWTTGAENQVLARRVLSHLLDRLDERGRAILFLHFVDGLDQAEVAEVLKITRRAVVKRLTKVRAALDVACQEIPEAQSGGEE